MPSGPSSTDHVMSSVRALKTSESTWRRFSSSWLRRIGVFIASWQACCGVSSSRLRSEPTPVDTLITIASRIGSIGGLVTCANSCLKYEKSGGWLSLSTASARSLPIEPIGSSPLQAVGASRTFMSSCV